MRIDPVPPLDQRESRRIGIAGLARQGPTARTIPAWGIAPVTAPLLENQGPTARPIDGAVAPVRDRSGLQPFPTMGDRSPGRCPGLVWIGPLALVKVWRRALNTAQRRPVRSGWTRRPLDIDAAPPVGSDSDARVSPPTSVAAELAGGAAPSRRRLALPGAEVEEEADEARRVEGLGDAQVARASTPTIHANQLALQ